MADTPYQDWLNKANSWAQGVDQAKIDEIRNSIAAAEYRESPDEIADIDKRVNDVLMDRMLAATGANLSPMYEAYLRRATGNMVAQQNLERLNKQAQGQGFGGLGRYDAAKYMTNYLGRGGGYGTMDPNAVKGAYQNIQNWATNSSLDPNDQTYKAFKANPNLQRDMANLYLQSSGLAGPWQQYLQNLANQEYSRWATTSSAEGQSPTYTAWLAQKLPQWVVWH